MEKPNIDKMYALVCEDGKVVSECEDAGPCAFGAPDTLENMRASVKHLARLVVERPDLCMCKCKKHRIFEYVLGKEIE